MFQLALLGFIFLSAVFVKELFILFKSAAYGDTAAMGSLKMWGCSIVILSVLLLLVY